MRPLSAAATLRIVILVQAGVALAIGLLAMGGWMLDAPLALRSHAALPPMSFNAALWTACCGIALASTTDRRSQWIAKGLGTVVVVMCITTFAESGRPPTHTAIAFALCGAGLLLHGRPLPVLRAVPMALCGAAAAGLALVSLFSYGSALHQGFPWLAGGETMPLYAAAGLALIGSGLAALAWFVTDQALPPRWIPFAVGMLGATATVMLWQSAVDAERLHVGQVVERQTVALRDALTQRLTEHVQALALMAHHWEVSGAPTEAAWRADAALHHTHAADYQTLEWWDADGVERWVEPQSGEESTRESHTATAYARRAAFAEAQRTGRLSVSAAIPLAEGGRGFLVSRTDPTRGTIGRGHRRRVRAGQSRLECSSRNERRHSGAAGRHHDRIRAAITSGARVPAQSDTTPLRVLMADDARDNVVLVRAFVRDASVELDTAVNGAEAVAQFRVGRYDLVLMDVQMPIVDGHTATRQIRAWEAQQDLPRTPIIALSAHALQEEAQQSLDAGCDAHLTKPIRKQTLLQAIDQYARTTRA